MNASKIFDNELQAALSLLGSNQIAEATSSFEKLAKSHSNRIEAWSNLGHTYILQARFAEAVEALETSLKCSPTNLGSKIDLAYAYSRVEKYKDSASICTSLLNEISSESREFVLKILKFSLGAIDDKPYVAKQTIELLSQHLDEPEIVSLAWKVLYKIRQQIDSIQALTAFVALAPNHTFAHEVLAYTLYMAGDSARANEEFELAIQTLGTLSPQDRAFHEAYNAGLIATSTAPSAKRRARFNNMARELERVSGLDGAIVESGMYKGLSAYIICSATKMHHSDFEGQYFYGFDSFEGLSEPQAEDIEVNSAAHRFKKGTFSAGFDDVSKNLSAFPKVSLFKGWIPDRFPEVKDKRFKFVHIDVDLYQPTKDSLEFFYPRLLIGGRIVCDDYNWSGQERAVKEFCRDQNIEFEISPYSQAIICKTQ